MQTRSSELLYESLSFQLDKINSVSNIVIKSSQNFQ